jgi:hypothetical protein
MGIKRGGFNALLLFLVVVTGCARLKQWAYEGLGRDQWQQPEKLIHRCTSEPEITSPI